MNRKLAIGLGGLAAVVLLGVFVVMPLFTASDDEDFDVVPAGAGTDTGDNDVADESDTDPDPDPVDETFEVFTARDPFQQLVSDSGGLTPVSDTSGEGSGGIDTDDEGEGSGGIDGVDDDDSGSGSGSDAGDSSSDATVGGTSIQLIEVFEDTDGTPTAQIVVNSAGYEAAEGEDFAGRFRVLDISGQCATLLYGDQRFTLCEGETIRK